MNHAAGTTTFSSQEKHLRQKVRACRIWFAEAHRKQNWVEIAKAARALNAAEYFLRLHVERPHETVHSPP